jgi:hypothetical protein
MTAKHHPAPVIHLTAVKSSTISHHGYDAATKTLAIKFSSGLEYRYHNVPQDVADKLGKAKSVGGFFASDIRNSFNGVKQEHHKHTTAK